MTLNCHIRGVNEFLPLPVLLVAKETTGKMLCIIPSSNIKEFHQVNIETIQNQVCIIYKVVEHFHL